MAHYGILTLPGADGKPVVVKVDLEALRGGKYSLKILSEQRMRGNKTPKSEDMGFTLDFDETSGVSVNLDELIAACEECLAERVKYQLIRFGEVGDELCARLFVEFGVLQILEILKQGDVNRIRKDLIGKMCGLAQYLEDRVAPDLTQTEQVQELYETAIEGAMAEVSIVSRLKDEWQAAAFKLLDSAATIGRLEREVLAPVIIKSNDFFAKALLTDPGSDLCRQAVVELGKINDDLSLYLFELDPADAVYAPDAAIAAQIERVRSVGIDFDAAAISLKETWLQIQAAVVKTVSPIMPTLETARNNLIAATDEFRSLMRKHPDLIETFREATQPFVMERAEKILENDSWGVRAVWTRLQQKQHHLQPFGADKEPPALAKPLQATLDQARTTVRRIDARREVIEQRLVSANAQPTVPLPLPSALSTAPLREAESPEERRLELYRLCQCAALVLTVNDRLPTVASHIGGCLDLLGYLGLVTQEERDNRLLVDSLVNAARQNCTQTSEREIATVWETVPTTWLTFETNWARQWGYLALKLTKAGAAHVRAGIMPDYPDLTLEKLEAARRERKAVRQQRKAEEGSRWRRR